MKKTVFLFIGIFLMLNVSCDSKKGEAERVAKYITAKYVDGNVVLEKVSEFN